MLPEKEVICPYCGEQFTTIVDSAETNQPTRYIEDCQICCRPILFTVEIDHEGNVVLFEVRSENE